MSRLYFDHTMPPEAIDLLVERFDIPIPWDVEVVGGETRTNHQKMFGGMDSEYYPGVTHRLICLEHRDSLEYDPDMWMDNPDQDWDIGWMPDDANGRSWFDEERGYTFVTTPEQLFELMGLQTEPWKAI